MASGSAQGSSTGTEPRRWTLEYAHRFAGFTAIALLDGGSPPLKPGERVEVVELQAPSERDVEAAARALYEHETRGAPNWDDRTETTKETWRDGARAVLAAVPSRPGGDAERVLDAVERLMRETRPVTAVWGDWLRENRDRILREAGQEPKERIEFVCGCKGYQVIDRPCDDHCSASAAGPGKEGAR